jgi:hypothetical protein
LSAVIKIHHVVIGLVGAILSASIDNVHHDLILEVVLQVDHLNYQNYI